MNINIPTMCVMSTCMKIIPFPYSILHHMAPTNITGVSEFLLMGFSEEPGQQPLIFGLFLSMYLITMFGNLLIILAVISDSHLHTPMYFFLSNLSFVDICFVSTTIPKMLWNIYTQRQVINYVACIIQVYFLMLFAGLDDLLLTVWPMTALWPSATPCTTQSL